MGSFVRIYALLWADILVAYSLFVMQNYLTDVWKLSLTHAAGILNIWGGISRVLPIFFLFLVDALLGNIKMLVISSIAYSVGIGLVSISTPPVFAISTHICKNYEPECIGDTQKVLFYTGMALIAVGVAGNLLSVKPLLKEQGDQPDSSPTIGCLRVPGLIFVAVIPIIGAIALPYVKPWSLRFGIPAICTVIATLLFLSGSCSYTNAKPNGSPLRIVCRVFVAAALKISQPFPDDAQQFYGNEEESFSPTNFLRCLHKAAIILPDVNLQDQEKHKWLLCSVAEVEAAKTVVRMVPMWTTFVICGIVCSIGNTYFVEQAKMMNRHIGKWKVPIQLLLLVQRWAKTVFANRAKSLLKKIPCNSAPSFGIAVAMIYSILCCITAAIVETFRLKAIRSYGLLDKPEANAHMSVFWLLFQFILLAGLDSFFEESVAEFCKDQSPDGMENYIDYFAKGVSGLGFMCSVLSVYVVGEVSEKLGGKTNWFQHTLNKSRLDRYYWVLAALSFVNLLAFILMASRYRYKNRATTGKEAAVVVERPLYQEDNFINPL